MDSRHPNQFNLEDEEEMDTKPLKDDDSAPTSSPSWFTPKRLLSIFCIINMINYVDRGAIASNGVNGSLGTCTDGGTCTSGSGIQGDFNLSNFEDGVLSSAFMVGLLVASPIFASLSKSHNPFRLIGVGLSVWTLAVIGCGCSFDFWSISICRMLVGVGEASFISLAAPFIDDHAPAAQKTAWLATFYMCIPAGVALGYVYGGLVGDYLNWRFAFWIEAIFMLPFAVFGFVMKPLQLKGFSPIESKTSSTSVEIASPVIEDSEVSDINGRDAVRVEGIMAQASDKGSEVRMLECLAEGKKNEKRKKKDAGVTSLIFIVPIWFLICFVHCYAWLSISRDKSFFNFHLSEGAFRIMNRFSKFSEDMKVLLLDKVYVVNVLGYIAYNFVIGAYSYWGPKAGYNIYHMSDADLLFGGITIVCGIFGTLSGGLILDYMGATISNAFKLLSGTTFLGATFCFGAFCFRSLYGFIPLFSVGELLVFATQAPVNYVCLHCVKPSMRPLAMAMSTVSIHIFGDVPSSPLVGVLQDYVDNWRETALILTSILFIAAGVWLIGIFLKSVDKFNEIDENEVSTVEKANMKPLLGGNRNEMIDDPGEA